MQPIKFRFGYYYGNPDSKKQWLEDARKVEELGYEMLLIGDHVFADMAPILALQAAAHHQRVHEEADQDVIAIRRPRPTAIPRTSPPS